MQRYQCHKIVEAARVVEVDEQRDWTAFLTLDDLDPADPDGAPSRVHVPARIIAMMQYVHSAAGDLGYFVRYADGYEDWLPTQAFEEGYTLIPPPGAGDLPDDFEAKTIKTISRLTRGGTDGPQV